MTDVLPEARPMEVELKYRMTDVATGERLLAADDLAGFAATGPAETVHHEDRYLDTADGALAAAGYAARLRKAEAGTVITLKGLDREDEGGALHRREELEGPADPARPPGAWPASEARDAVVAIVGAHDLEDLVALRQVRRKRTYAHDGTVVELSVDDVEVVVGGAVAERFAELELELREGSEAALEPLADMLSEIEELVAVDTSKLERALEAVRRETREARSDRWRGRVDDAGLDLGDRGDAAEREAPTVGAPEEGADPRREAEVPAPGAGDGATTAEAEPGEAAAEVVQAPRILVPKSPGVLAEDHLAEAGRKVLRFHLARMITREAGTREGKDAEELHAMRVATRRQRAAWRVFGEAFDPKRTARHRRRLRLVAADLGAVRDLDVLIEAIEAYQERQPSDEAAGLEPLVRSWRRSARRRPRRARPRARLRPLPPLGGRLPRLRAVRGPGRPRGGPDGAAPRPRHDALAGVGRVPGRPRLRARHALGRRRDAPRAAHRRQVAALHPRVRPGGARPRRGSGDREGGRAPGSPRLAARRRRGGRPCPRVPRRARRRPDRGRERRDRALSRRPRARRSRGCAGRSAPRGAASSSLAFRRALGRVVAGL